MAEAVCGAKRVAEESDGRGVKFSFVDGHASPLVDELFSLVRDCEHLHEHWEYVICTLGDSTSRNASQHVFR